jgi:hypothetical protein
MVMRLSCALCWASFAVIIVIWASNWLDRSGAFAESFVGMAEVIVFVVVFAPGVGSAGRTRGAGRELTGDSSGLR